MVTKDARWPAIPLLAVRGTQFLLGLMCLGMAGALINSFSVGGSIWELNMALTVGLFTMIYAAINFFLFFINLLLPLAIVIVDAFLLILWLVAVAGLGDLLTRDGIFSLNCSQFVYPSLRTDCGVIKALWAFSFMTFLLFIATTALASYILHINRKDLRGAKYNTGQDPNGNELETGAPVQEVYQEHNPVTYPPQVYEQHHQQPQGAPSDGYYPQSPVPVVSPPQTPAPNPQQQYQHQQQYAPSPPPPPPPPPPVNAQEMPAYQ